MSRERYRWDRESGSVVRVGDDAPRASGGPTVITDEMPPTWHPATGEMLTSKRGFRQRTRAAGCVEIGNEPIVDRRRDLTGDPRPDIARAIEQLQNR